MGRWSLNRFSLGTCRCESVSANRGDSGAPPDDPLSIWRGLVGLKGEGLSGEN